jgi:putative tricarboxylic transport membrane protein
MTASRITPSLLFGIAFVILGIYVSLESLSWQVYNHTGPGPGFFPLLYGCAMAVLGFVLAMKEIIVPPTRSAAEATSPILAAATLGLLALSVPLMWVLGFVVGFGIALLLIVKFIFGQSWIKSLVVAASIVGALHVGFGILLQANLPGGMFWGF